MRQRKRFSPSDPIRSARKKFPDRFQISKMFDKSAAIFQIGKAREQSYVLARA